MHPNPEETVTAAQTTQMELRLLGLPRLIVNQRDILLERKAAALLAYLSFEGECRRSRVAGLLWPDSSEQTARNNLSQTLRRLRQSAQGQSPVIAGDTLRLNESLPVDVLLLLQHCRARRYEQACLLPAGGLLDGAEFDDCDDLSQWLNQQRNETIVLRVNALEYHLEQLETSGDLRAAIGAALQILLLEPYRESSYLHLMQLYYQIGDRSAALNAFQRCKTLLNTELGIEPQVALTELADIIRRSSFVRDFGNGTQGQSRKLPMSLLQPPVLIGRQREWDRMEEAWDKDLAIFISGPPGCGKTRLMQDFLGSKGRYFGYEGRPEDLGISYATHSRSYRQMLAAFPCVQLPNWVRRELSRIIPELDDAQTIGGLVGKALHQPVNEEAKLRLYQAKAEATDLAVRAGMQHVTVDNLHYVDPASIEAGHFVYAHQWTRVGGMRSVICFREAELGASSREALAAVLDAGMAVLIQLKPLDGADSRALIHSLDLDADIEQHTAQLHELCGGLPFFLLETLREMYRDDLSVTQWLESGHIPPRIHHILQRQFSRLGPDAQKQILQSDLLYESKEIPELTELSSTGVLRDRKVSSGYLGLYLQSLVLANC